jgi:molecular chaperone GrpE
MSEGGNGFSVKVNDRRRFDADGNPRDDDAAPEEPPPVGSGAAAPPRQAEATSAELEAARRRVDELARAYQAVVGEKEEFKQRLTRERERMLDVERGEVAQVLLDVVDELDLSLRAAPEESPLARGVKLIRAGILAKLQASGIERIQVLGLPYDPNLAEASDMEVTPDPDADQRVTAEVRAGYRLKGRVIRPARVRVAKYVAPASA